jgi:hypothetical protein
MAREPKEAQFKIHEDKKGNTVDLVVRVSTVENGWIIKAGAAPFFCANEEDLTAAVANLVARFTVRASLKRSKSP